jgi:hypothetical protein
MDSVYAGRMGCMPASADLTVPNSFEETVPNTGQLNISSIPSHSEPTITARALGPSDGLALAHAGLAVAHGIKTNGLVSANSALRFLAQKDALDYTGGLDSEPRPPSHQPGISFGSAFQEHSCGAETVLRKFAARHAFWGILR